MNSKIVVTNKTALQAKYGARVKEIHSGVGRLIAADKARGVQTSLLALDDRTQMSSVRAKPVTNAGDPRQNKDAIDAVFQKHNPEFLVILGSVDVIPHQDVRNPLYDPDPDNGDPDEFAYGDMPYACDAPYSQDAKDFIAATRVVGRIPDITGSKDPEYLIELLQIAANWQSRDASDYLSYLGISAEVWRASTAMSLRNTFGSDSGLQISPTDGPRWIKSLLSSRSHFINCHGAVATPIFFGQPKGQDVYPDAHLASWVDGRMVEGTLATAECCYGAELYDPTKARGNRISICNTYLKNKAYAFFGSSTIAYGPEKDNGWADLITQFFFQNILTGASTGRAALEARQRFAQSSSPLDAADLKTLAQFVLLGDPSIQPVITPRPHEAVDLVRHMRKIVRPAEMRQEERTAERFRLFLSGQGIAGTQAVAATRRESAGTSSVKTTLVELAREAGVSEPKVLSFAVDVPRAAFRHGRRGLTEGIAPPTAIHIAIGRVRTKGPVPQIVLISATEKNGEIVTVRKGVSR